jgi:peptidoglycan/LPS O-acetylase OafA/YrhL
MKKTIATFVISTLLLASVALWVLKGRVTGNIQEMLTAGGIFILVGFALFIGVSRLRSRLRREPSEDELSRGVMTKASSLAYYISIYLWLFIMYISDRTTMPVDSLIGAGILGMAMAFFFSWLFVKLRAKND